METKENTLNLLTCVYWFESFWLKSAFNGILLIFIFSNLKVFFVTIKRYNIYVNRNQTFSLTKYIAYLYRHNFNVWSKSILFFYFHWFIQMLKWKFYCYIIKSHKRKSVDILLFFCSAWKTTTKKENRCEENFPPSNIRII